MAVSDRDQIVETVTRVSVYADARRWDDLTDVLADTVRLDYTAMLGGEPVTATRADVVAAWSSTLGALAVTQHLVANHLVSIDGDHATVTAAFQATHVPARPDQRRWVLGGDYEFRLVRIGGHWRIAAVTMTPAWETGDRSLVFPA